MATLLDNPAFAADFQPILTAFLANPNDGPTQQTFINAYAALLNQWASTSALGAQVVAQNALVQALLTQFNAIGVKGSVLTIAALDALTGVAAGDAYFCQADYHLYAYIGGNWIDLGLAGTTPDLTGISSAGQATINKLVLQQLWFEEG